MSEFRWPVVLERGDIRLRPIDKRDEKIWRQIRTQDAQWLMPWEATHPEGAPRLSDFRGYVKAMHAEAKAGRGLPMAIDYQGEFVGQITLGNVSWGSFRSGYIGYWVRNAVAGRGITTTAVAMLVDYALTDAGMHRIEINIRPENAASLRVVAKLGLRFEGTRQRLLHIDGAWRDHHSFAILADERPAGGLSAGQPLIH